AVWLAPVGGARVQAGETGAGLGRLPGPLRPGDPPALGAGLRRVLLLLVGSEPAGLRQCPSRTARWQCRPLPPPPPGGGSGGKMGPTRHGRPPQACPVAPVDRRPIRCPIRPPGPEPCARCRVGLIPGASCTAVGRGGRRPRRLRRCRRCWTP